MAVEKIVIKEREIFRGNIGLKINSDLNYGRFRTAFMINLFKLKTRFFQYT